jgi:hypothetical protein
MTASGASRSGVGRGSGWSQAESEAAEAGRIQGVDIVVHESVVTGKLVLLIG